VSSLVSTYLTWVLQRWLAHDKHTHTHTHLTALCPGLPRWAGTRKVKPIWILLELEIVSDSGISWVICKSPPRCRQITTPAPHYSVFYRPDALPATQPTASKHWRQVGFSKAHDKVPYKSTVYLLFCNFCVACCVNRYSAVFNSYMFGLARVSIFTVLFLLLATFAGAGCIYILYW